MTDTPEFYAILTETGRALQFECLDSERKFVMTEIAVGDGNGSYYEPEKTQTVLKNECYRHAITRNLVDRKGLVKSVVLDIPESVCGFTVREVGVYGENGDLLIVGKYPATEKRESESGAPSQLAIKIDLTQVNELVLPVLIDPSVNTASVQYVEEHFQALSEKGQAGGYAVLDSSGKVPQEQLPDILDKINVSKALETGAVSTDPDVYAELVNRAQSMFDLSKFTVVGSPRINNNGVYSKYSTTTQNSNNRVNYVQVPLTGNKNIRIRLSGKVKPNYNTSTENNPSQVLFSVGGYNSSENTTQLLYSCETNSNYAIISSNPNIIGFAWNITNVGVGEGDVITVDYVITNGTTITATIWINGVSVGTKQGTIAHDIALYDFARINLSRQDQYNWYGDTYLNTLEISVDGVPVFSGNKTGIDIIKPDDYTVAGSPTITDDGIASGFSNTSYISKNITQAFESLEACGSFNLSTLTSPGDSNYFCLVSLAQNNLSCFSEIRIDYLKNCFNIGYNIENQNNLQWVYTPNFSDLKIEINKDYYYKLAYKDNSLNFYLGTDVNNLKLILSISNVVKKDFNNIKIGVSYNNFLPFTIGTLDLNSIKIYADSNLVYQPCLKIPYTRCNTGSKIVDVIYRDRVQDRYELEGYAPYFTLDEENKNFTLPMGELYGYIENVAKKDYSSRNVSEMVFSLLPLTDAGLHLLDGALISGNGVYAGFVSLIAKLYGDGSNVPAYFTTEEQWQQSVTTYGVCGKFVYDPTANTVRLPKITGIVEGTLDPNALGDLVQAGLPAFTVNSAGAHTHTTTVTYTGSNSDDGDPGKYIITTPNSPNTTYTLNGSTSTDGLHTHSIAGSSIIGNSDTVQPQTIKGFMYIVIATSVKTDVEVDIDNITADLALKADTSLDNLTLAGDDKINVSKALETGAVSTDTDVYAQLVGRAQSMFDLSKFTVVGSPMITDNGILSNGNLSNCVKTGNIQALGQNWDIIIPYNTNNSTWHTADTFFRSTSFNYSFFSLGSNATSVYLWLTDIDGTDLSTLIPINAPWGNVLFRMSCRFENNIYTLNLYTRNTNDLEWVLRKTITSEKAFYPCENSSEFALIPLTSDSAKIDLKLFEIVVNNIPVFSGNKTGIDIIKPDDYTVVGNPTITDDGIASGFSNANYIKIPDLISNQEDFEVDLSFSTPTLNTTQQLIGYIINGYQAGLSITSANKISWYISRIENTQNVLTSSLLIENDKKYKISIGYKNSVYFLKIYDASNNLLEETQKENISSLNISSYYGINLGIQAGENRNNPIVGNFDLNSFKIYVNGNLVYQPCLKIPYTLSNRGSMIVDAIYRDRVRDRYELEGYAPYFTLDEENKNFTLPMGELYGYINKVVENSKNPTPTFAYITETYTNGTSGYVVYSNGLCEQWGRTTAQSQTVTLLKAYKDTNYLVLMTPKGDVASGTAGNPCANSKSTTQILVNTSSGNFTSAFWYTKGFIEGE